MNIEQICADANSRVVHHINRSAGQHLRAMRLPPAAPTSAEIYAMCMESDTADQYARWMCAMAGVSYPPINEGETA